MSIHLGNTRVPADLSVPVDVDRARREICAPLIILLTHIDSWQSQRHLNGTIPVNQWIR